MTHSSSIPQPDWTAHTVVTVDPDTKPRYYERYDVRPVYAALLDACAHLGIEVCVLRQEHSPLNIWVRDWGFAANAYFTYAPPYDGPYEPGAIQKARARLSELTGCSPRPVPLIFDGGNLVHNGSVAIVTDRVLDHNRRVSKGKGEAEFIKLGFERVVFVPAEPGDQIGHADGILRFSSPNVLLVNDYKGAEFRDYGRKLRACLAEAHLGCEIVPFPWFYEKRRHDGVDSAKGYYINFVLTAQGAICPAFEDDRDDEAAALLEKHTGLPVRSVMATPLARWGGVLNCVTLTL